MNFIEPKSTTAARRTLTDAGFDVQRRKGTAAYLYDITAPSGEQIARGMNPSSLCKMERMFSLGASQMAGAAMAATPTDDALADRLRTAETLVGTYRQTVTNLLQAFDRLTGAAE